MHNRTQQILVALQTIVIKEIVRFTRIWSQTLLPPAITMTLYFLIFGKLIGSQIQHVAGFSYMQYIVPGLVMMSVITSAYSNTSTSFFGAKFSKSVEELLVAPVPNYVILTGFVIGGVLRGLMVGMIVLLISLLFTHLQIHNLSIVIAMAILSSMLFSLAGLINAIFAKKFDDVFFIPTFVLTPLTYLGGIFYSINALPGIWRQLSYFNPIVSIVDTFRYGLLGVSDMNITLSFAIVLSLFVGLTIWCLSLLQRGIGLRS